MDGWWWFLRHNLGMHRGCHQFFLTNVPYLHRDADGQIRDKKQGMLYTSQLTTSNEPEWATALLMIFKREPLPLQ